MVGLMERWRGDGLLSGRESGEERKGEVVVDVREGEERVVLFFNGVDSDGVQSSLLVLRARKGFARRGRHEGVAESGGWITRR